MRLEQLLYHENLCGWNSCYTTRTYAVGTTIISREPGCLDYRCGWADLCSSCLISQRPRAMYSFILILLACVILIDGINSFSIVIV